MVWVACPSSYSESKGGFAITKAASILTVGLVYNNNTNNSNNCNNNNSNKNVKNKNNENIKNKCLPNVYRMYSKCIPSPLNALVSELQVNAVWHNMREEPVIYINGRPFVLREDERPFKNMQEYTGIDVQRLEQMELRLKNDILQVACSIQARWALISHSESTSEHLSRSESTDGKLSMSSMIVCWCVSSLVAA